MRAVLGQHKARAGSREVPRAVRWGSQGRSECGWLHSSCRDGTEDGRSRQTDGHWEGGLGGSRY